MLGQNCVCCLLPIPHRDRDRYFCEANGAPLSERMGPSHCADCADWRETATYRKGNVHDLPPWALPGPREKEWE